MNLPTQQMASPEAAFPMTRDEAMAIVARAAQDKYLAQELDHLREKCCRFVDDIMHRVNREMADQDQRTPALLQADACDVLSLRNAARGREKIAQQRRELAEAMVIGALFNSDNPDWNPLNPDSRGTGQGSLLLALLQTPPDIARRGEF
ncbi:hypothetical protein [Herbaspirillum hiltneri]|nr:hypothetical protein [Herbaspirillum hiltneri]